MKMYGICGPTASGKTGLAIEICLHTGMQVISADSMQIYRGMGLLSAKPDAAEMKGVKHYLIDNINPGETYNASKYRQDALSAVDEILRAGSRPLLCGGTGLYIDALTKSIRMSEEADEVYRNGLKLIASKPGGETVLHDMLLKADPESAAKYPPGDVRRVIRSLEIIHATGKPRGDWEREDALIPDTFETELWALKWDREVLYKRIGQRVDEMVRNGLIDEVRRLSESETSIKETAAQAIGYKEIKLALDGGISMRDAIENVKMNTRHLAKRQETWFRRDKRVTWRETDGKNLQAIAKEIAGHIAEETDEQHN